MDIRTWGGLIAVAAVLVAAVLAAATGGSWELEERSFDLGGWYARAGTPEEGGDPALDNFNLPPDATPQPSASPVDWSSLRTLGWVALGVVAAVAGWWLWLRQRTARRGSVREGITTATVVEEPELPILQRGVAEAQRFLAQTAGATDAVIAAWLALEEAAAASGVGRAPSQTPTEFTLDVLERTNADPAATSELLSLYHRARFSSDRLGAEEVARASRCFGALAAGWGAVTASSEGAR